MCGGRAKQTQRRYRIHGGRYDGEKRQMLTGLLLGAGASYEAGMPLVWELSKQIRAIMTPDYVRTTKSKTRETACRSDPHRRVTWHARKETAKDAAAASVRRMTFTGYAIVEAGRARPLHIHRQGASGRPPVIDHNSRVSANWLAPCLSIGWGYLNI